MAVPDLYVLLLYILYFDSMLYSDLVYILCSPLQFMLFFV